MGGGGGGGSRQYSICFVVDLYWIGRDTLDRYIRAITLACKSIYTDGLSLRKKRTLKKKNKSKS